MFAFTLLLRSRWGEVLLEGKATIAPIGNDIRRGLRVVVRVGFLSHLVHWFVTMPVGDQHSSDLWVAVQVQR